MEPGEVPTGWTTDGRSLYIYRPSELPARVYRIEISTGKRMLWKQIMPSDSAGVDLISPILITPPGKSYVYEYGRTLSDLYLVEGLK